MNWLVKRKGGEFIKSGLIITLLALILFSCEEPNEFGEDFISDSDKVSVHAVEIPVTGAMYKRDSVTLTGKNILVGKYSDPSFGEIEAEGYSNLYPVSYGQPSKIKDATYDSLTITLKIDKKIYGNNVESPQPLKIYQLQDTIYYGKVTEQDTIFDAYTFSKRSYDKLIGETEINIRNTQPNPSKINYDSIYVQFKLDNDFGMELFNKAKTDSALFTSSKNLRPYLKGLAFVPGDGASAIFIYDIKNSKSSIKLHYHTTTDTLAYTLKMGEEDFAYSFSYLQSDLSQTPLSGLPIDELFESPDQKLYAQAGTMISSVLDLSAVKNLKDTIDNPIVVNNATLFLEVEPYAPYLKPPDNLGIVLTDSLGQEVYVGDSLFSYYYTLGTYGMPLTSNNTRGSSFTTSFNSAKKIYAIDLTLFVQGMINDAHKFKNLALYPKASFNTSKQPTSELSLDRLVIDPNNIRFVVYYTTLD